MLDHSLTSSRVKKTNQVEAQNNVRNVSMIDFSLDGEIPLYVDDDNGMLGKRKFFGTNEMSNIFDCKLLYHSRTGKSTDFSPLSLDRRDKKERGRK